MAGVNKHKLLHEMGFKWEQRGESYNGIQPIMHLVACAW